MNQFTTEIVDVLDTLVKKQDITEVFPSNLSDNFVETSIMLNYTNNVLQKI